MCLLLYRGGVYTLHLIFRGPTALHLLNGPSSDIDSYYDHRADRRHSSLGAHDATTSRDRLPHSRVLDSPAFLCHLFPHSVFADSTTQHSRSKKASYKPTKIQNDALSTDNNTCAIQWYLEPSIGTSKQRDVFPGGIPR